jgi:TonB family protein
MERFVKSSEAQNASTSCYPAAMRKTTIVRTLSCCVNLFCFVALGLACLPAFAQDAVAPKEAAPAAPTMPADPKALMLLAARTNGLTGPDVQPWHLKATYKIFDEQGNDKGQGTYEELWISPTKYRRSFTGAAFSRTDYGTEEGDLETGDQSPAPWQLDELRHDLVNPLPREKSILAWDLEDGPNEPDIKARRCITVKAPAMDPAAAPVLYGIFCFDPQSATLLSTGNLNTIQTFFSNSVSFQGRFLPGDLELSVKGQTILSAHLESFETLTRIDEAAFVPPPDATTFHGIKMVGIKGSGQAPRSVFLPGPAPGPLQLSGGGKVAISPGVAVGLLISKVAPVYPPIAKAARVQGTVSLQALIGKDGQVKELHVISGPAMLQQAAIDAVKQWIYKPYRLNGDAVEVLTVVNVIFTLGDKPQPNQALPPTTR